MANYEKAKINLANTQPSKLKFAEKLRLEQH